MTKHKPFQLSVTLNDDEKQILFKIQAKRQLEQNTPVAFADILRDALTQLGKKEKIQ